MRGLGRGRRGQRRASSRSVIRNNASPARLFLLASAAAAAARAVGVKEAEAAAGEGLEAVTAAATAWGGGKGGGEGGGVGAASSLHGSFRQRHYSTSCVRTHVDVVKMP